jgi:hypothetical protein
MKRLLVWLGGILLISNVLADTIILKNGDKVQGTIISENDAQVVVEHRRAGGSIVTHDTVAKSNIRNIERDTPEQKQEQLTYEALQRHKLDPNQEYTKTQYASGINAFNDFLIAYPGSKFADEVTSKRDAWTSEQSYVERGQVKLNNQWMTASEKQTALVAYALNSLKLKLADLRKKHDATAKSINDTETAIQQDQFTASNPPTKFHDSYVMPHGPDRWHPQGWNETVPGYSFTDTEASQNAGARVIDNRRQLDKLQAQLSSLEAEIDSVNQRLPQAEAQYKATLSQSHQPTVSPKM